MPRLRLPISAPRPPRHPTISAPAVTPGSQPNPWDPVPKPGNDPYTPDGNAIYVGSSGFEELKDRAIISATIEFLDCGPLPPLLPARTPAAAAQPLSPLATATSSSSSRSSSISFTPINRRVLTPPTSLDTSRAGSPASDLDSGTDTEPEDSDDEWVEPTSSSSSFRKRKRGDQPSPPRKRPKPNHQQQLQQPQHRNHVVLRLQTRGTVDVNIKGTKRVPNCCGVIVSVEESASEDNRCYLACKPISYSSVTRKAAAAFSFDILGGEGLTRESARSKPKGKGKGKRKGKEKEEKRDLTLRDVLQVIEIGGLLPFRYSSAGKMEGGEALEVGCRDWMTQLFCRLHQAGYVSWHAREVYPESLTGKGFQATGDTTSFAHIIGQRYSGIRKEKGRLNSKFPYVEPSPIVPGQFGQAKMMRWKDYNGERLGYEMVDDTSGEESNGDLLRRSSRLAARAKKAS
ncbi:hypothetical protein V8F20_004956 [Naviculisporaceae sp. PSN 640]